MKGNRPRAVPANPRTRAIRAQQHQLAVGTGQRAPRPAPPRRTRWAALAVRAPRAIGVVRGSPGRRRARPARLPDVKRALLAASLRLGHFGVRLWMPDLW
ncbi:hypothetical protein YW7DRAFT_03325 [Streptomyces sp. AmelKG-E11A]|nr:hypothetical protein YW7DRAFT_03325 [Streptomyces sp. AmelKG-E11A]